MNMVATDYAWLMVQIEKHSREVHDACLLKQWELARNHALVVENYLDSLINWLASQEDGLDGKFEEVWVSQQETV